MKKIILSLLLVITLYTSATIPTYALVCSNCSTFVQQIIDYTIQGSQLVKETVTASVGTITATQQTLDTVNNTILKPMKDALTLITILKSGENVQNLILGSLGADPLLVKNPELYLENKGLGILKASLGDIASQNSLYGDSVLDTLISSAKYNYSDTATKLKIVNQSSIPSIIQSGTCDDETLSNLAREDVAVEGEPLDQAAFIERKNYFNDAFCKGDPNTDPVIASNLVALSAARPQISQWDTWLARTGGDNPYTKSVQSQQIIADAVAKKVETARNDLNLGGGIKSLMTCVKRAPNNINGEGYEGTEAPCIQEEIVQAGSVLLDSFKRALGSPLETLISSFGSGAGSLISSAFSTINMIQGIGSALNSVTSDGSTGGGSTGSGGSVGGSGGSFQNNTSRTVASTAIVRDLANNPTVKTTLTNPAKKHLIAHAESMTLLETTSRNYLSYTNVYTNKLNNMKSCFDTLSTYEEAKGNPSISAANAYYAERLSQTNQLKARIEQDIALVIAGKKLIANTLTTITNSQSSEEILTTFNDYQNMVDTQNIPGITAGATREGEYTSYKGEVDQSDALSGPLYSYNTTCTTLRQQFDSNRNNNSNSNGGVF